MTRRRIQRRGRGAGVGQRVGLDRTDAVPAALSSQAKRLLESIAEFEECRRHPFKGIGKPEPLGGNLSGWWSRRISHEHRLVYCAAGAGEEQVLQVA